MDKTLNRKLFKKIKHNHRSSGIASGLAYRPGYKVGGRVGFEPGGSVDLSSINPNLRSKFETQKPGFFLRDPDRTLDLFGGNVPSYIAPKKDFKVGMSTDPEYQAELIKKKEAEKRLKEFEDKQKFKQDSKFYEDAIIRKNRSNVIEEKNKIINANQDKTTTKLNIDAKAKSQTSKMYEDLMAKQKNLLSNRESLDNELQTLREKQRKDNRLNIALKTVQAMNDPNLRVGQSRVAAGVDAFTDEVIATNKLKAEQETADMLTKYNRLEDDITRSKNMEDYFLKQDYTRKYGSSGERMEQLSFLLAANGAEPGTDLHKQLTNAFFIGVQKPKDLSAVSEKISNKIMEINDPSSLSEYTPNQYRIQIAGTEPLYLDAEGQLTTEVTETEAPLTMAREGRIVIERMKGGYQYAKGGRVGFKTGGRVGYKEGELVTEEQKEELIQPISKKAPMVMTKDQLRKKLPEFIDDEIVSLIAYSPDAFADFASIQTRGDADDFNDKYDVRLQLPELDRMDFSGVEEKMSAPAMPITAPTAVPAQPNTATQTGAGANLTPTEVALLDPTEQAIRMRNS
tara:strand:- start:16991 stop:18694 length:1704 start_codon:yes stop_codon:yes gene_type:complete